jgi:hypothetical protein
MDVEFLTLNKDRSESRLLLKLSEVIESCESDGYGKDYNERAVTRVRTTYGSTHSLLIAFDEFKELYEKMLNKKIVIAR